MKVDNKSKYKLIFSISNHTHLGVMIHPYVVAITSHDTLSLTYQKVFSGNADYYTQLTESQLELITTLDDIMVENIVRKFSPVKKIRPKEFFHKHFSTILNKEVIQPFKEKRLNNFLKKLDEHTDNLYVADDINPAATSVKIEADFTKVLFHFRRNENGTSYFVTLKHQEQKVPFMKLGAIMLTHHPARMVVNGSLYKFYDFVDGGKLGVFIHKKYIHIRPESEKKYYTNFIKGLMATAPVFAEGFEINTVKEPATPLLLLSKLNGEYGFRLFIKYGDLTFPFHQNKMYHVDLHWVKNNPIFTRYKRSQIWEANRVNALSQLSLVANKQSFFQLEQTDLRTAIAWLQHNLLVLEQGHFVVQSKLEQVYSLHKPHLNYDVKDKIDWFDVHITLTLGEFKIPFSEVVKQMKKGIMELELPNGEIFLFPEEWSALGSALASSTAKNNVYTIKKYQVNILNLIQSNEIKKHLTQLVDIKKETPHSHFVGTLRPYQQDGLSWLMFLRNNRFGGILADDMGLGKTVQTLAFLQKIKHEKQYRETSPFLLVVPTSLLYNWKQEVSKFSPDISIQIHTGQKRKKEVTDFRDKDLIITSYGLIRNDGELFQQFDFEVIILDESQNIKNYTTKTTQYINKLKAECRVALTGTPIENTLKDLWSQMNFLNKGLLGSLKSFEENYAKPIEKQDDRKQAAKLLAHIKPFILRRTKEEVAKDLPPITEKIIYCEMTEEQSKFYEKTKSEYRNNLINLVDDQGIQKSRFSILQGLSKLRQIANHPYLIDKEYKNQSGKHELLLDKIQAAIQDGHKVLVFSQFVSYLSILEKDIAAKGIDYFVLTGSTSKEKRAQYVTEFQNLDHPAVFLISLKAGGTGLNLTSADYVFIVDPWWNPAAEAQARDRTHRIGQKHAVFSYKFISKDTIEEKITALQNKKQGYSKNIIVTENNILTNLDVKELDYLLQ